MKIPYVNIAGQFERDRAALMPAIESVLESGMYVNSPIIADLEEKLAIYHGVAHCVCLNSGTDALVLAMKSLGIGFGDEVITQSNSFVASAAAIAQLGAIPIFVDVLADQSMDPTKIEDAITSKTKAIMPVHLTGRIGEIEEIQSIAQKHKLFIVEDAAQAIGADKGGKKAGNFGDIGCFSAHPLKNMGACGDAGFVVTNNASLSEKIHLYRNHGLVDRNTVSEFGAVSRMDVVQAAILHHRLTLIDDVTKTRQKHATLYKSHLDPRNVFYPEDRENANDCYHTFVIQVDRRDALQNFLAKNDIGSAIHYPIPIHMQPAASHLASRAGDLPATEKQANRILTLPIHELLSEREVIHIANMVNKFYEA